MKHFIIGSLIAIFAFAMVVLSWRAERWFNWNFGYGPKVEKRISELEARVERLERD